MVWYSELYSFLNSLFNTVINNFLIGILILLIGLIVGRIAGKIIRNILHEFEIDALLRKAAGLKTSVEELISLGIRYIIYFIFAVMALNQIGITSIVLTFLSGAVILVILITSLLAIKDLIPNILSGLYVHHKGLVKKGTKIRTHNVQGKIIQVGLLETTIKTSEGDTIIMPNSLLTKDIIVKKR